METSIRSTQKQKKKVLFVSNIVGHITAFHLPYLKWFSEHGYEVHVMANSEGKASPPHTVISFMMFLYIVPLLNLRILMQQRLQKR